MSPNPIEMRDFATRYTAAWCSRDPQRVAGFYSPEGSLSINGGPPAAGRGAITAAARSFMTAFPDLEVVMNDVFAEGDRAKYQWTLFGTNTGPGGAGHKVRISGYELWQMGSDGLIASSHGYFDTADYQRQLEQGMEEAQ